MTAQIYNKTLPEGLGPTNKLCSTYYIPILCKLAIHLWHLWYSLIIIILIYYITIFLSYVENTYHVTLYKLFLNETFLFFYNYRQISQIITLISWNVMFCDIFSILGQISWFPFLSSFFSFSLSFIPSLLPSLKILS